VPTAYVNTALLNLRAGPNTEAEIVGQVASGNALPISGQDQAFPDWWQVSYNGSTAWVYGPLITTGGPMEQVSTLAFAAPSSTVTDASADIEGASLALSEESSEGEADTQILAGFAAVASPTGPQLDPNYQPVLPYLAR
jgi:hypothetical protein